MADKDEQYQRLPAVLQTTAIKNFFEYTVDQLYSEANVETLNGFVGTPNYDGIRAQGAYIEEPTATKQAYSLSPTISTISPESGEPENLIFYDEVVDILETYGVDVRNQPKIFDSPYFTFSPPINEDKLLNYSEYYWAPPGANVTPNAIIISGTVEAPVDVEEDITGQQYYVHYGETANTTFRNGMVVTFDGLYITPFDVYSGNTYVVEGVGHEIDLVPADRNSTAPYDASAEPNYVVIERGAVNNNGWSRNNYWYHVNNWYDAGEVPPGREYRAQRPIIEFNHRLETFNQGTNYLQSVDIAVTGYNYNQVNGLPANVDIDGVNPANTTMIFPSEGPDNAPYVYLGVPYDIETTAVAYGNELDPANVDAILQVEIAGDPGDGFVDKVVVIDGGVGYVPEQSDILIFTDTEVERDAQVEPVIYKGIETGISTTTTPLSLQINNSGLGYESNTISISFISDDPTGIEEQPVAVAQLDGSGSITQINVITRGSNYKYGANISVVVSGPIGSGADIEVLKYESYIASVNVIEPGKGYTQFQSIVLEPVANVSVGDSVLITQGSTQKGNEYYYTSAGWILADTKRNANDAPLFVIYDDTGARLDDEAKYPQSDFAGNKIFSYATLDDISNEDAANVSVTTIVDPVLGFPLVYRPFKAASEIVFTNNLENNKYTYKPLGSDTSEDIIGYNFYHLLPEAGEAAEEFFPYWKPSDRPFDQAIISRYPLSQIEIDRNIRDFFIGCIPNPSPYNYSKVDVKMYLNGKPVKGFTLNPDVEGYITVADNIVFTAGDYVELIAYSDTGLISMQSSSKYELPLGWDRNIFKEDIRFTSEPEFLEHFKTQIQSQIGFVGESLGQNNYQSTAQDTSYATEIVQSSADVILASYLLDDQPHNLIDALRFNAGEYGKYKARLKKSINDYYASNGIDENNIDQTLELILREVIAFRVGKNVFNRTYVVPFGDNYFTEQQTIGASQDEIILNTYLDLSLIEHSLLVFATPQGSLFTDMLVVDRDYVIENNNPITIRLIGDFLGSTITTKLYTSERDSAQCPPTPSVLGIYPLFQPEITIDNTFETPQEVVVGHDGSKTATYGDARDQLLLDFEQRIYNAAKKEFREANSLPELNFFDIRPGEFRTTGYGYVEWYNLMRYYFSTWTSLNDVDPVTNEFYDPSDVWTWNYRGASNTYPGHWRGLYEYYYDTVRPHTHPWEMLGFTEKPLWWNEEYGTDYGSGNDAMWNDLESGIIRQGPRENLTQDLWKLETNPYARPYLFEYLPVNATGDLIEPNTLPSGVTSTYTDYQSDFVNPDLLPLASQTFISPSTGEIFPGIELSTNGANVYIESSGVLNYEPPPGRFEPQSFDINLPKDLTVGPSDMPVGDSIPDGGLIGIAVNGIALINPKSGRADSDGWNYNEVFDGSYDYSNPGNYDSRGGYQYYIIPPQIFGWDKFETGTHSPVIGWALDGLPIYGPYGYTQYNASGDATDQTITNIKSPFELREDLTGGRPGGPGGAPTGLFLEDYTINPTLVGMPGYAGTNATADPGQNYAIRYGVTPESPNSPIWFYVQCQDDVGAPMFPYACGGGIKEFPAGYNQNVYDNQFFGTPNDFGGVFGCTVTDCGYGYTGVAGVVITGDGENAAGYSTIQNGVIRNVVVVSTGKNYAWDTTTIEILGDGTGAKAVPIIIDGKITGVRMTDFGEGYSFATPIIKQVAGQDGIFPGQFAELLIPTVAEDPANGIVNDAVTSITVTNKGYGYTYVDIDIQSVVGPQPPILTPVLGYGATATGILETTYNNSTGNGYIDPDADKVLISEGIEVIDTDKLLTSGSWRYSDGAPVENAWKYSESYPFAVAEGLLLGQPAQFATQFADPTKLFRAEVDSRQQLCTVTRERWQFTDPAQFRIHGERDSEGNFLTNIGYTQFTNSWLAFQGLDTNIEFAPQLRTINMRLSHRMSGYIDKDTMTVRTDQYSATGTTPSLIIPQDNINVQIHSSPYKTRNFYTGVIIEKAVGGYRVRGFDRSIGTFPTLAINKNSPKRGLTVGGEPAPFSLWEQNTFYKKLSIVQYAGAYYQAPRNLTTGADFDSRLWNRLSSLPQINGASAAVWSKYFNQVEFVPYETLLETPQQVVDLLMGMGAWQQNAGYDFQGFDYNTGDSQNWEHAAKQFLFWTTAKWEIGNTVELSPMATGVTFKAPRGFIAKLNRIDRNQFTILDADGSAITPESCEIIRLDDYIQVKPPQGAQIYGMLVFVKEIEHAMTLENRTDFNDIIYDPVLHQYQTRLKIKGKRTADWDGKFSSEGFIILDDELKPNLDNLAQSMGRYHELGFIPVEKQVYESARSLFGYQSRAYLRDLDILDDQQFDFYKGMLQSKGTQTSMTRIGESNSIIIDGQITVYDEWAVKVGDFGDVQSQQAIEFKLDRSNVTSDPQLVTLVFPEDVTGVVDRIDVVDAKNTYLTTPAVQISAPLVADGLPAPDGRQATAKAYLKPDMKLDYIEVTDKGRGYEFATATIITQGDNNSTAGNNIEFTEAVAQGGLSEAAWAEQPINGNCYINVTGITIQFSEMTLVDNTSNAAMSSNVSLFTTNTQQKFVVGQDITLSGQSGIVCKGDGFTCADLSQLNGTYVITNTTVTTAGTTVEFVSDVLVGDDSTYGVNVTYESVKQFKFEFDDVYYHEANIDVTPFEWGGKDIEDIFNVESANTGVTASMYASHIPNNLQPGQTGDQVIDWYTLVLRSDTDFELIQEAPSNVWTDQFHIATGVYQNQQRWAIDVASDTEAQDIVVVVNGQIIDQCKYFVVEYDGAVTDTCDVYNWDYMPGGDYTGTANLTVSNQSLVYSQGANNTVFLETYGTNPWTPKDLDDDSTGVFVNRDYPFLDLYIGNILIKPQKQEYIPVSNVNTLVWRNVWTVDTVNPGMITINTAYLPASLVDSTTSYLKSDVDIQLIEKASIEFTDDFNGDVFGSNISISVESDDDLLVKIGRERTYEITKDIANDDIIVIDVDDPTRFLKKPTGEATKQLWPTYNDVNYLGVKDSKDYPIIPNSGYVNSANVNFQAYDIASLPFLFDPSIKIQPTGGHTIHVASSENSDWNVYELMPTNADVQFVARQDDRVSLFTNYSLFNYIDGNMIGEDDTGRYLDYYLTLRNADVSDNVVIWTNETIIQQAQTTITDITAPRMIEARIRSLAPSDNSLRRFTDYIPQGDNFYNNVEMSASGLGQGQQKAVRIELVGIDIISNDPIVTTTDPNLTFTSVVTSTGSGTGANVSVVWDTAASGSNFISTIDSIAVSNGGAGYTLGDELNIVPADIVEGTPTLNATVLVSDTQAVETAYVRSNVITIGRIQNSTIQENDTIRLINGGGYSRATVTQSNISLDYDARTITFSNVSNASEFISQNILYVRTNPNSSSNVNRYAYTILSNTSSDVTVTSSSLTSPEAMAALELGDFGSTNEIRSLNVYDLGDPRKPNDDDTYYSVFNVQTNGTGTTTLQIERPDTYFNQTDVTSLITNINITADIVVTANVAGNVFTVGQDSILIEDYPGVLGAMNGLWTIYNVTQNPADPTEDLITFNTLKTLPQGQVSTPPRAYKSDTSLNVNLIHLNKTRLVMPGVSDINVGDQIKVLGNVFNGTYNADSVIIENNTELNDDSFTTYVDIPAPYIFDSNRSGNVLLGGLKITTTNPHGISPEYAAQNKRIGIHFAYPKAYNRFYNISRVDAYNIYVDDVLTQSDDTIDYYRYETASVARNDNVYVTTNNPMLTKTTVTYASNSSVIAPNNYSVNDGIITFSESVLPQSNSFVTVNIVREINRSFDRYPVVTTIDHNKIRLNGVNFTVNSYNNPEAIAENINRSASLMRGWLTPSGYGMEFSFPMLKDYRTPVFAPDGSLRPAHTINNYGPYIRDKNTLARISNDPDIETGTLSISDPKELNMDDSFNLGAIKIGPTKGATYYDSEEKSWMIWLQEGPTDTQGGYYPLGVYYDQQNRTVLPKRKKIFKIIPESHVDNGRILDVIPGSYPTQRNNPSAAGQTQYEYDLTATKEYNFPAYWIDASGQEVIPEDLLYIQDAQREAGTVKIFRYRLKPSTQGYYEVYETVQLTNGEVITIKVDSAIPPVIAHNFYGTQSAHGNFFGLASNSINFDTKVSFNATNVNLYPSYSGGSLVMGPVSPPSDIGKTLIPEPFAFRRSGRTLGNGTDSLLNWEGLPDIIARVVNNGGIDFDVTKPGYDTFKIWQPGMIPGIKNPPNTATSTIGIPFGKGRGYYEKGDGNTPEMFQVISVLADMTDANDYANITMGWADPRNCPSNNPFVPCDVIDPSVTPANDYPIIDNDLGWYNPQPRFKYSKRFSLQINTSNDDELNISEDYANSSSYYNSQENRYAYKVPNGDGDGTSTVFVNGNYPSTLDTAFRPDEIFVACFWTEPHIYQNQTVGYGPDPQNAGTRRPIIKDYQGTITRCKYIRLTELPLDAVLTNLECDTGWGGEDINSTNYITNDLQNRSAMDLLTKPTDVRGGTSATQNNNINTGAIITGGVSPENPTPNETSSFDINNTTQLPGGYQARDNNLIEPDSQPFATLPNTEASQATGIGLSDISTVAFGLAQGETPFDNAGSSITDTNLQQSTAIVYPTIPNTNGGSSPVFNPDQIILPGKCDIEPAPQANIIPAGGSCDAAPSTVLAFTGSNNYYGIILKDQDWVDASNSNNTLYEWHTFGKVSNKYKGGTRAYVEIAADFRDDTLTAGGITVVQSSLPFGKLPGGASFNPRNPQQQSAIDSWWESATIIPGLNSIPESTPEIDMLKYGADRYELPGVTPDGRAKGKSFASVTRIGLSETDGSNFSPLLKPSNYSSNSSDWLTTTEIIGGSQAGFATCNSLKGAFGFRAEIDCAFGEYLTVFVHIGKGSGGNAGTAIPRYDFLIKYDHNVSGFSGSDVEPINACGDGNAPASQAYAGGAHAKAYKSQTTTSQDARFKSSTTMRPINFTNTIKWGLSPSLGKDDTKLLSQGEVAAWLFDNIYFPYNAPVRQGEPQEEGQSDTPDGTPSDTLPQINRICCNSDLDQTQGKTIWNSPYCAQFRGRRLCPGTGTDNNSDGGFGGGTDLFGPLKGLDQYLD